MMKVSTLDEYDAGWILEKMDEEILNLKQS